MVDKKNVLRLRRGRSVGLGLIAIMGFLIAGFVFEPILSTIPLVAPQFEDQFEIPFVTPEQEQNNQEILKDIEEVVKDQTIPPEEIPPMVEDLADEIVTIPPITNETSVVCTDSIPPTCNTIPPVTSEDPPLVQIGDILDDNPIVDPILPESTSLDLLTRVTKIDSQGNKVVVEKTTTFSKLAFLVEEKTNIDYKTGFLEIEMFVKGEPNTKYSGSGTFDIMIGTSSIFSTPIKINFDQVSDGSGMIPITVISPLGGMSTVYTFDFNANFNKFINEKVTKIDVIINSLDTTKDQDNFSIQNISVFTMDIARDDIQIIITDEEGITSRVYPTDSKLVVTSVQASSQGIICIVGVTTGSTFTGKTSSINPADCLYNFPPPNYQSEPALSIWRKLYPMTTITAGTAPAPQVLGLNLYDIDGNIIKFSSGGTGTVFNELVTRNTNYTLKINSPLISSDLSFGKAQQTQSYSCQSVVTTNYKIVITSVPPPSGCGFTNSCFTTTYHTLYPNGISSGAVQCNLPK